jgi:hypothetical protein
LRSYKSARVDKISEEFFQAGGVKLNSESINLKVTELLRSKEFSHQSFFVPVHKEGDKTN